MADVVKYGVHISNRIFVGGVAFDTKEDQLKNFFSQYGKIRECKIIKDSQNISRGFAFVTFECKHDAFETQQLGTVFFNQKKLNLGPAIRQKGVVFDGSTKCENEPVLSTGVTISPSGVWYFDNPPASPEPTNTSPTPCLVAGLQKGQPKTQEYQPVSSVPAVANCVPIEHPGPVAVEYGPAPVHPCSHPIHCDPPEIAYHHHHHSQFIANHGFNYGYHHSQPVSSDIHVSFQNMTISPRPPPISTGPSPVHNQIPRQPVYSPHVPHYAAPHHVGPVLTPHPSSIGQGYVQPNHLYDAHVYDYYPAPIYSPGSGSYAKKNYAGIKKREKPPRRNEKNEPSKVSAK